MQGSTKSVWAFTVVLASVSLAASRSSAETPNIFTDMLSQGIEVPGIGPVQVAPPTLETGLSTEQKTERLSKLAGGAGWKRFSRKSDVAPVAIKMSYLKDSDGKRLGHSIHAAFVIHVDLDTLANEDLMRGLMNAQKNDAPAEGETSEVSKDELNVVGITADPDTTFAKIEVPLLKKVRIRGVMQVQRSKSEDMIQFAFRLDPRFADLESIGNGWSRISDETPNWMPYQGAGGYMQVSRLPEPEGACLIESRFIVHEPSDWFRGSNLLRSKLPLMIQESARSMRRKLKR